MLAKTCPTRRSRVRRALHVASRDQRGLGVARVIVRFEKSPRELLPTQSATGPGFASPSRVTTRSGASPPFAYTDTCVRVITSRSRTQLVGSGTGETGCSYLPGDSVRSRGHGHVGWETYCTARFARAVSGVRKLKGLRYTAS